jgi:hypothetical protein
MNAVSEHLRTLTNGKSRHHRIIFHSRDDGKTKLCLELLKKYRGVYFLCRDIQGVGGQVRWSPCQFIKDFHVEMENKPDNVDIIHRFVHKIYHTLKTLDGSGPLFQEQFDESNGVMKPDFYNKFSHTQRLDSCETHSSIRLLSSESTMPSIQSLKSFHGPSPSHDPFLIVFDESHAFDPETFSLLKYYLDKYHVLGLFVSTSSHLTQMVPRNHSNRGDTSTLKELCPLFFLP